MNPLRVMIVLVAAVAAIGLAVVMQKAMGGKPAPAPVAEAAPAAKPMTQVLVAKRDLAVGDRLTGGDVTWQPWPSDTINAAFITNGAADPVPTKAVAKAAKAVGDAAETALGGVTPEKAVEGAIVRDPILAGEPITARKIVRGGEGGYLSVVLGPGKRAMAVPVTSETAVGGFILPGDRVDVIQTHEQTTVGEGDGGGKQVVAETVIQNVRVLALDQTTAAEKKDAKTIVASTATLEVGPVEAEALSRAKASGPVTLTLRAYTDLGGPSGAVSSPDSSVVRINRGGQTSSISVRQ
ncbi:MAG: Flp pilus assembly protein CpaB [Caulobacter sp.]|nr:Flp pilus assembly protein CpaB [Caulobacter sp.]